ncbi:MAG: hypothetical protein AAF414_04515 [Pseudomonadota bacterium]
MSFILRQLIMQGARRIATDPRLHQKVKEGAQRARPVVERSARNIKNAAKEKSPLEDPRGFAEALRRRLRQPD